MFVAVYCAARDLSENINNLTLELGKFLGQNHHTLIYGGCNVGLMNLIADSTKNNGGKVIGVLPNNDFILQRKKEELDEYIYVNTLGERIDKMNSLSDIIIALPGGPGTLNEISSVMDNLKLGTLKKKLIIYNIDNYYDDLQKLINKYYQYGFVNDDFMNNIIFVSSLKEIKNYL